MLMFFFNDTATTEIYTLSLHDALPISSEMRMDHEPPQREPERYSLDWLDQYLAQDRKSTRLNSSHANISYAVFCLKKKTYIIPYNRSLSDLSAYSNIVLSPTFRIPQNS